MYWFDLTLACKFEWGTHRKLNCNGMATGYSECLKFVYQSYGVTLVVKSLIMLGMARRQPQVCTPCWYHCRWRKLNSALSKKTQLTCHRVVFSTNKCHTAHPDMIRQQIYTDSTLHPELYSYRLSYYISGKREERPRNMSNDHRGTSFEGL